MPNSVAGWLDEIENRASRATEGPWEADFSEENNYSVKTAGAEWIDGLAFAHGTADADFMAAARTDVPRLLAALRAVLNLHTESRLGPDLPHPYCGECGQMLPCATRRAIAAALGEES